MTSYVTASLIAGVFTMAASLIGFVGYLWRRDPAAKRNNILVKLVDSIKQADERSMVQHAAMLKTIEETLDWIAPRSRPRPGSERARRRKT